jgi:hypothetical protein
MNIFVVILWCELMASHLQNRHSTTWVSWKPFFCVGYFKITYHEQLSLVSLDPWSSWSQSPEWLGFQVGAIGSQLYGSIFKLCLHLWPIHSSVHIEHDTTCTGSQFQKCCDHIWRACPLWFSPVGGVTADKFTVISPMKHHYIKVTFLNASRDK